MEFDGDHVDGGHADIAENLDEVAADCTESFTAFWTTFLVDLHTTRLARSALSY